MEIQKEFYSERRCAMTDQERDRNLMPCRNGKGICGHFKDAEEKDGYKKYVCKTLGKSPSGNNTEVYVKC